jgi:hypothetical protein
MPNNDHTARQTPFGHDNKTGPVFQRKKEAQRIAVNIAKLPEQLQR